MFEVWNFEVKVNGFKLSSNIINMGTLGKRRWSLFWGVIFGAGRILGIFRPIYREKGGGRFLPESTHTSMCVYNRRNAYMYVYINTVVLICMKIWWWCWWGPQRIWYKEAVVEKVRPELQKANRWEGGEKQTSKDDRIWMAADKCSPPENLFSFYIALIETL